MFFDESAIRDLLGLLWQVQAAAIALVLAASLFAFESLTRRREEMPLAEYARRSGLAQFMMLSAWGLLSVPVPLVATPDLPSPTASFAAAVIGAAGLAGLPFFIAHAMDVVHPSWLRRRRLEDVRQAVHRQVDRYVFERIAAGELQRWAQENGVETQPRIWAENVDITERSRSHGEVLDIDLDTLATAANADSGRVIVLTQLGERVRADDPLIARGVPGGPLLRRRAVTTSRAAPRDNEIDQLVRQLHEEALKALRDGSVIAAEDTAAAYVEAWLAWPRAWADYGQHLQGGRLGGTEPFQLRASEAMTRDTARNIVRATQEAVDLGLPGHVDAFLSVLWRVGPEAVRLEARHLISHLNRLAQGLLTTKSNRHPDLGARVRERASRYQVDICRLISAPLNTGRVGEMALEAVDEAVDELRECFVSLIESLRLLFDVADYEAFKELDSRFGRLLWGWNPLQGELADRRAALDRVRRGGRLLVLGWVLRTLRSQPHLWDRRDVVRVVRELAGSLGGVVEVVEAAGWALEQGRELLSRWMALDMPEGEVYFVDTDGPVLEALAVTLLSRGAVPRIEPADWMTHQRIDRFAELAHDVARRSVLWNLPGEHREDVMRRSEALVERMRVAEREQRRREEDELVARKLDEAKVRTFRAAVADEWRAALALPDLARLTGLAVVGVPTSEWTGTPFGFPPQLLPKGLFVTPTNWVGLEGIAADFGRDLARGEVTEIVRRVVRHARGVHAVGGVPDRVNTLLAELRRAGYEPSLIICPQKWQLLDSLGLAMWWPDASRSGLGVDFRGSVGEVPVITWDEVPDDRILAVDLGRFCTVRQGVDEEGAPSEPTVSVDVVDEQRASEILDGREPSPDPEGDRRRLLTQVEVRIHRPYQVEVQDENAVRWVRCSEDP